jgi:hypothetical protein
VFNQRLRMHSWGSPNYQLPAVVPSKHHDATNYETQICTVSSKQPILMPKNSFSSIAVDFWPYSVVENKAWKWQSPGIGAGCVLSRDVCFWVSADREFTVEVTVLKTIRADLFLSLYYN